MKILIVEDSSERINWFSEEFKEHDLMIVNNAIMGIQAVEMQFFPLIMLDHDLGQKAYCPSDEKSGYAVAVAIAEGELNLKSAVIVHSWNPQGAKRMYDVLKKARVQVHQMQYGTFSRNIIK